jgi:O-antigen/teichoic acid export membrane protein
MSRSDPSRLPMFRLVSASAALLLAKSALLGIRVAVLLLVAGYASRTDLASASLALSLAEIGRWISDFGTDTWNVRAIAAARSANDETRLVTATLLIKAAGWVLVGSAIFVICCIKLPAAGSTLGIMACLLLMTSQISGLTISYFQAKDRVGRLLPMLVPCLATVLAAFLSLKLTGRVLVALGVMTGGEICIATLLLGLLRHRIAFVGLVSSVLPDAGRMARACIPTALLAIIVGIHSRADTVILAEFSLPALAVYTVAQRVFLPFQIAMTSFGNMVYTQASIAAGTHGAFARQLMRKEMPIILGCSIACAIVLLSGGRLLIKEALPQYPQALGLLTILCALLPLFAFNSSLTGLLLGSGRFWTVLSVAALDLILTCACMIALIPSRGAFGAPEGLLVGALANATALSLAALFPRARVPIPWDRPSDDPPTRQESSRSTAPTL